MKKKKIDLGFLFGESIEGVDSKLTLSKEEAVRSSQNWEKEEDLEEKASANISPWRLVPIYIFFAVVFVVLSARAFSLQVVDGASFLSQSAGNHVQVIVTHAPRGVIYDRNGKVLVRNIPGFRVALRKIDLPKNWENEIKSVAKLLNMNSGEIIKKVADSKEDSVTLATNIPNDQVISLKTNQEKFSWLSLEIDPKREYLYGESLGPLLGYTGEASKKDLQRTDTTPYSAGDQVGKAGVESQFESELRGANGYDLFKIDSKGKKRGDLLQTKPLAGGDIRLSIDADLQKYVYDSLVQILKDKGGQGGSAIVMSPKTGEILAMVSTPGYDNNLFSNPLTATKYNALLNDPGYPLLNRALESSYPPGSTFKLVVGSEALESGLIKRDTKILDTGFITLGDVTFNNWLWSGSHKTDGEIDIVRALARSNDTFFYKVGQGLGVDKISRQAVNLGFGSKTGINLPGETSGVVPTPDWKVKNIGEVWYPGDTINYSIGQGYLLVSPLQLARATAVFANGGKLVEPSIIKSQKARFSKENVLRPETITTIREGMYENTVGDGNVSYLFSNYKIKTAGKTGSAEVGGDFKPDAWYTAFAPFDDPQIVTTVMFERGGHGADLSAPLAKSIFNWYFKL